MLERVQREGHPLTRLVGMQTSAAAMENNIEIPSKTGNRTANDPAIPLLGIHTEETRIETDMYPTVHCSTVYNSQDMETT